MTRHLLTAAFALAALATVAASPSRADDWSKSYPVTGRPTLNVTTGDGNVVITGSNKSTIDAHITTTGYKLGPNDVQIVESQTGNTVTIQINFPHMNWHWNSGRRDLTIDLQVPSDLDMKIVTSDGNVSATTVNGNMDLQSGDGNISAKQVRGTVKLHTGDGNVDGAGFDGSLEATTGDGNLKIEGRFDSLNLKSGDGSIDAQANLGSKIASAWGLHSGDGRVTLRVPGDLNADVDAHTGDGSISMDIPVAVSGSLSHSSIRGKMNQGGGELKISSGDGSIHIEKL
jgi:DUF4097 and DUF4098 domain-containing protein YvlB